MGYIFSETPRIRPTASQEDLSDTAELLPDIERPPVKMVVLGDTSDPSAVEELAQDATLLVHESTNAFIPPELEERVHTHRTPETVQTKAISRGHSTPVMAGDFAKRIRTKSLYLNHFSSKYVSFFSLRGYLPI
jgi:ribonuclease Z